MNSPPDTRKKLVLSSEPPEWGAAFQGISWWDVETMKDAWVLVVGAGALGNEVLKNLVLLGVGHIVLVDFDRVEHLNLCRSVLFREEDCGQFKAEVAARRLRQINPEVEVVPLVGDIIYDIGLGVIRRMDVVIGCLDNRIARLHLNRYCHLLGKIWVDGAIENLSGRLDVYIPGLTCYECQLHPKELEIIRHRMGCMDVAQRNANFGRIPTTPISSSIIAAMQVQEAMKVIAGNYDKLLTGKRFFMEGMNNMMMQYNSAPLSEDCMSHNRLGELEAIEATHTASLREVLDQLVALTGHEEPKILLPYEIALQLLAPQSEYLFDAVMPMPRISNAYLREHEQIPGEGLMSLPDRVVSRLDHHFPHLDRSLEQLGVPPLQILTVETNRIHHVELAGDISSVNNNI